MENRENMYYKMPFYMTYPIQNLYLTEMEYEKDMERMKELYPRDVQPILAFIEQRCDELEKEGSRLYDENPDRFMLDQAACRLYEEFLQENPQYKNMRPERPMPERPMPQPERPMPERPMPQPARPRRYSILPPEDLRDIMLERNPQPEMQMQEHRPVDDYENSWLRSLIDVIFKGEVYRRRCRNRRCRRWQM